MKTPKTLLELAGVASIAPKWETSALLMVDPQMEYVSGGLALEGVEAAIAECAKLQKLARDAGAPIFHIVHHGRPGGALFNPNEKFVDIIPQLRPMNDETVVIKHLPNSFAGTQLDKLLKDSGRKQLVIAGFATHMCISATARAALDLGYSTTVVADACGTRDLPNPFGGVVTAEAVHQATLAALADRFATVVRSSATWIA